MQPPNPKPQAPASSPPDAVPDVANTLPYATRQSTSSPYAQTLASTPFAPVDPEPEPAPDDDFEARYEARELLGEGGMGEVRLYRDRRIGRDVALKAIRPGHGSRSDLRRRFVREARVQGQLEHPAIVPVYDLSLRPQPAYFTMKRVRGVTLEHVVERLRAGDAEIAARFSRRKLLTAFGSVCLALDYAHAHGVVHRDLKPANVMLGDFGEVYVLDWGVARVETAPVSGDAPTIDAADDAQAKTAAGSLMGTLGYMAPEQVRGETVDSRADVYALGSTLFEMLALVPLHEGKRVTDMVRSTLEGADARASRRAPDRDVPPELEAICVRATALSADDRYASARELHEAIERYLDGDRDVERRRSMADRHASAAAVAAERALRPDAESPEGDRSTALHEVGRALALDPTNAIALQTTLQLRLQPPRELPEEAAAAIEASRLETIRESGRAGTIAFASTLLYLPLILWMGVRDPGLVMAVYALLSVAGVTTYWAWRHPSHHQLPIIVVASSLAFALLSRVLGPFLVVPGIIVANTTAFAMDPSRARRLAVLALGCLSVTLPALLEWLGWLAPSYVFREGTVVIVPHMASLPGGPTLAFLLAVTLASVVTPSLFMGRVRATLEAAERRIHLQAWQLKQLVPDPAHETAAAVAPEPPACPMERSRTG